MAKAHVGVVPAFFLLAAALASAQQVTVTCPVPGASLLPATTLYYSPARLNVSWTHDWAEDLFPTLPTDQEYYVIENPVLVSVSYMKALCKKYREAAGLVTADVTWKGPMWKNATNGTNAKNAYVKADRITILGSRGCDNADKNVSAVQLAFRLGSQEDWYSAIDCARANGSAGACTAFLFESDVANKLPLNSTDSRRRRGRSLQQDNCDPADSHSCGLFGGECNRNSPCNPTCVFGPYSGGGEGYCGKPIDYGCFPSSARVQLADGATKPMSELQLGDRVLSVDARGSPVYSPVYLFGHRDAAAVSDLVRLGLDAGGKAAALTASRRHFVPTCSKDAGSCGSFASAAYKHMAQVRVGDWVWTAQAGSAPLLAEVVRVDTEVARGLFNPFTEAGPIVVDGVVASSHSDWFLDALTERVAPGALRHLPTLYQALMAPLRVAHRLLGTRVWSSLLERTQLERLGHLAGVAVTRALSA